MLSVEFSREFGIILHVPFLRIRHLYVMLFMSFTSCNSNVGRCVKGSLVQRSRHVTEWLGLSFTVRVRVWARARKWDFSYSCFLFSPVKVTNTFVLHIKGSCDVHGIRGERTATVRDVNDDVF